MRLIVEQATVYRSQLGGRRFLTERAAWRCHVKELLSIRHVDDGCECRYSSTYPEEGVVCVVHNAHNLKLINRGSALLMRWSRSSVADPEQGSKDNKKKEPAAAGVPHGGREGGTTRSTGQSPEVVTAGETALSPGHEPDAVPTAGQCQANPPQRKEALNALTKPGPESGSTTAARSACSGGATRAGDADALGDDAAGRRPSLSHDPWSGPMGDSPFEWNAMFYADPDDDNDSTGGNS